ncbi:hypothetical protein HDU76_001370 [Blyttiomyces sp. JEL0837]|nr:hypothetical protein HDU76_001370 [Blyttiomyces sp. JEL0837]
MSLAEPALLPSCNVGSNLHYQYYLNEDIDAYNLQVISNIGSSCDCANLCANAGSSCGYYVFGTDVNTCWLKQVTRETPSMLTWFLGSASPISGNIPGFDLDANQPSQQQTADLCLDLCSKSPNCYFVNFDTSNGKCWMKQGRVNAANRVLGFNVNYRVCGNQVVVPGQDIPGYDLGQVGFTTSCDCAAVCQNTQGCDFYNYNDHICYLKSTIKSNPNAYTWFLNAVSPIRGDLPNLGAPNTVDELLQGPISMDSPQSCINLCKQTQNCLFVNFQITNTQTAAVSCTLKKGFTGRGFQSSFGFNIAGSGSIPQPVGVTTVVPEVVPSNTAVIVPGGPGSGNGGSGATGTDATFSLGGVVGATSNLPTPTLVGGGSGGNTNGGQGSGGNGSNGGTGNGGTGSGNSGNGGTNASSSSSSFPVVAVAGGVGGIVLIGAIIAGILVYRRRSSRNGKKSGNAGGMALNEFGGENGGVSSKVITSTPKGPVALRQQQLNEDFKPTVQSDSDHLPVWSPQQQQVPSQNTNIQQHVPGQNNFNNIQQQQSHIQQQPHQYSPTQQLQQQPLTPPSRGSSSRNYPPANIINMDSKQSSMFNNASGSSGNGAEDNNAFTVSNAVSVLSYDGGNEKIGYGGGSYPVDTKQGFDVNNLPPSVPVSSTYSTHVPQQHVADNNVYNEAPPQYPGNGI